MGVLLQAYYKQNGDKGVPSPFDGDAGAQPWWDRLAAQAHALRQSGFTAIWLPPLQKGASGVKSIGFDMFDDYDIGSKDQKGSVPTRYGTREQLQRCVAILRANGLDVYLDLVENQRGGGSGPGGFTFEYKGADGAPNAGRFRKTPTCFHPNVPQDPGVFGSPKADQSFGADLAPINGRLNKADPPGYVGNGLIAAAEWLVSALDIQGFRIDDTKGVSDIFLRRLLDSPAGAGRFAVGEFFDGNIGLILNWIFNPHGMGGRASSFDFPLRFMLAAMCNQSTSFDMSLLDHAGLTGDVPLQSVTFVENHDTDVNPTLTPVIRNKLLGYAYILTSEGFPCVYYRDYSPDPGCYGLKPGIDNLIWIHETIADGPTQQRWKERDLFVYERLGGAHLLVGLNNGVSPRTVTVDTGFGGHAALHDYTGHGPDVTTDGAGRATLTIPTNRNGDGNGYVCYSRNGIGGGPGSAQFHSTRHPVVQTFEAGADLDTAPARNSAFHEVGRVWPEAQSTLQTALAFDSTGWSDQTTLTLHILAPDGVTILASRTYQRNTPSGAGLNAITTVAGAHSLQVRADNAPPTLDGIGFKLSVTYTAPIHFP